MIEDSGLLVGSADKNPRYQDRHWRNTVKSMVNVKSWSMLGAVLFACVFAVCFAAGKEPPGPEGSGRVDPAPQAI